MVKELIGGLDGAAQLSREKLENAPGYRFEISRDGGVEWQSFTHSFALDGSDIQLVIPHIELEEMIPQGWLLLRIVKR